MLSDEQALPVYRDDVAPPDYFDLVIEAFKKDVDRTLLRENLKLSIEQRIRKAQSFHRSIEEWRAAGAARMHPRFWDFLHDYHDQA